MGSLVAMRYRSPMSMTAASSPTRGPTTTRGSLVWCLSKIACSVSARSLPIGRNCMPTVVYTAPTVECRPNVSEGRRSRPCSIGCATKRAPAARPEPQRAGRRGAARGVRGTLARSDRAGRIHARSVPRYLSGLRRFPPGPNGPVENESRPTFLDDLFVGGGPVGDVDRQRADPEPIGARTPGRVPGPSVLIEPPSRLGSLAEASRVELEGPSLRAGRGEVSGPAHEEGSPRTLEYAGCGAILAGHRVQLGHGLVVRLGADGLEPAESRLAKRDPQDEASRHFAPDHLDPRRNIDACALQERVRRRRIDRTRIADVEAEARRVAELDASWWTGERASQAHEDAIPDRVALEMIPGMNEGHRFLRAADRERKHQAAARPQVSPPRRGDVPRADREDDSIVRRAVGIPEPAVAQDHLDPAHAGSGEVSPGAVDDIVVDVHGDERAGFTQDMSHQPSVVAGAGADLEDAQPRFEPELLEHRCHDFGL